MARCLRTAGGRPKAWIGAAIGLGTQIIGGLINKNAQEEQDWAAKKEQDYQNAIEFARNMNQQMRLTQNAQKAYEEQFRLPYRRGGRQRLRNAVSITDGGIAIPEGNSTFLLRGSTHEQVNESGNTGIGINVGGKEIEAENGELVDVNNGNLRVFSNSLPIPVMTRGGVTYMTPSKAVLAGYNKNRIFNEQQRMNGNSHGGGGRTKAALGASFGTADYIGLGTNILGSILSQTINRKGLSGLAKYAPSRPIPYVAGKLITNYNINPQLSNLERSRLQAYRSIDRDTASSIAANERRNAINLNTTLAENELYNKKYQTEADMLNKDTLNQQEIVNKSIAAYNDWRDKYNNYMAALAGAKSESNVAMIQGIGSSIGNFLQQGIDRHQMELNRRAYLATADKGNDEILAAYGLFNNKELRFLYEKALKDGDEAKAQRYYDLLPKRIQRKYAPSAPISMENVKQPLVSLKEIEPLNAGFNIPSLSYENDLASRIYQNSYSWRKRNDLI